MIDGIGLNAEADVEDKDWAQVAKEWLRSNGFITIPD